MANMMYRDAVLSTIAEEMERDSNIVVLGEDVVGGMGTAGGPEAIGGIWSTSTGLFGKFGKDRVIDTPISESAIIGDCAPMMAAVVAASRVSDPIGNGDLSETGISRTGHSSRTVSHDRKSPCRPMTAAAPYARGWTIFAPRIRR